MPVFNIDSDSKLRRLSALRLQKERDLQKLIENNLSEMLGLKLLASEYTTTSGGRIDTLAVYNDGAPVIIEYKRSQNDSVINQALSYLRWLQSQRSEFFQQLMINILGQDTYNQIGLDWKNPRVICIAESYSRFDMDTIHFVLPRIELYRYRLFEEGIFTLDNINAVDTPPQKSGSLSSRTNQVDEISESPVIDENFIEEPIISSLVDRSKPKIREIFHNLREKLLSLDEAIKERPTRRYIGYRLTFNFADFHFQQNSIKIYIRPIEYIDPKEFVQPAPDTSGWTLSKFVQISNPDDVEYVASLIEQSYNNVI